MSTRRIITVLISGVFGAAAIIVPAPSASAYLAVINFDSGSVFCSFDQTTPLRDEYASQEIRFRGPTSTDGGAILDQCSNFGVNARSGTQFLAFNTTAVMTNGGVPRPPERILLNNPRTAAEIFVSQGQAGSSGSFKLIAKRAGNIVATSQETTTTNSYIKLQVSNALGFTKLILKGTTAHGYWVADDLAISS